MTVARAMGPFASDHAQRRSRGRKPSERSVGAPAPSPYPQGLPTRPESQRKRTGNQGHQNESIHPFPYKKREAFQPDSADFP
jgi:hypothetical protein